MPKNFWKKCGKLIKVQTVSEIGFERFIKITYENGSLSYTYDLKKDRTKDHKLFINF